MNFHLKLFNGNHEQCGIVDRVEKCILNNLKNCNDIIIQKDKTNHNILMKLHGCKVNETFDVS